MRTSISHGKRYIPFMTPCTLLHGPCDTVLYPRTFAPRHSTLHALACASDAVLTIRLHILAAYVRLTACSFVSSRIRRTVMSSHSSFCAASTIFLILMYSPAAVVNITVDRAPWCLFNCSQLHARSAITSCPFRQDASRTSMRDIHAFFCATSVPFLYITCTPSLRCMFTHPMFVITRHSFTSVVVSTLHTMYAPLLQLCLLERIVYTLYRTYFSLHVAAYAI
jgi:hypothetical protein